MAWHPTQLEFFARQSPLPETLEEAQREVLRLRRQLVQTNERIAKLFEKNELDRRSLTGQVRALQKLLAEK